MSTLSGNVSKGEKGKSRFQSLDINSLYRGESLEPHQLKPALPRKHGMQSLGKVPSTRRPPANLPSLKSEHSGNDPAISLVPSGGTGWGSKPGETGQPPTPSQTQTSQQVPVTTNQTPAPQTAAVPASISTPALVPPAIPPPAVNQTPHIPLPTQQAPQNQQIPQSIVGDKSWSSIMAGPGEGAHPPSFLAHQSPQFQHEFPKLSGGDGQAQTTGPKGGSDTQYGPGPSLRPQTEGSWIQGGGRSTTQLPAQSSMTVAPPGQGPLPHIPSSTDHVGSRNNLAPHVPPGVGLGPGGPASTQGTAATSTLSGVPVAGPQMPHMPPNAAGHNQFRNVMPPFMYRGNFPPGGFPPNFPSSMHGPPRPRFPYQTDSSRYLPPNRSGGDEDTLPRPIIKEEDLNKMDDIAQDPGWATHDDIDYNQKLAFSDDEDDRRGESRGMKKDEKRTMEREHEIDSTERDREEIRVNSSSSHGAEEDEMWRELRRQQSENIASVVERAKQRKEEEEKRFESRERAKLRKEEEERKYEESKQRAAQKQKLLEQKMGWDKPKESVEDAPVSLPLPDWEKNRDKDRDNDSRERERSHPSESRGSHPSESRDDKARDVSDFRQLTQIERPSFMRNDRERDRESSRSERERDLRSDRDRERDRDRDLRGERDRQDPVFSRQFQNNLPPRFQKQQAERQHQFLRVGSGGSNSSSQSLTSTFAASSFDMRWNSQAHSGSSNFSGPSTGNKQSSGLMPRRHADSEASNSDRDHEIVEERPPSRDQRELREREFREKDLRERKDRHTPDVYERDRYRPPSRDSRLQEGGGARKLSGSYYEGSSDYTRPSRSQDLERPRETDQDYDFHHTDKDRTLRETWDPRSFSDRKDDAKLPYDRQSKADSVSDKESTREFNRQESNDEWHDNLDWKISDERDGKDWESEKRDREEPRPQRPDSRDSRTSRESRTSRDSNRDDKSSHDSHKPFLGRDLTSSWADSSLDSHYSDLREERPKKMDYFHHVTEERERREFPRHAPVPITREKLEAAELRGDTKRNLTQLKRSTSGPTSNSMDKKSELKRNDSQTDKSEKGVNEIADVWNRVPKVDDLSNSQNLENIGNVNTSTRSSDVSSKPWSECLTNDSGNVSTPKDQTAVSEDNLRSSVSEEKKDSEKKDTQELKEEKQKTEQLESGVDKEKTSETIKKGDRTEVKDSDKREKSSRGRGRMDQTRGSRQNYGGGSGGYAVYRGGWGQQREGRGRRGNQRMPRGNRSGRNWSRNTDSELSGDEVSASTESGKEEIARGGIDNKQPEKGQDKDGRSPRSPKGGNKKPEKEDRNREIRRDSEKTSNSDTRHYDKRGSGYESTRGGREGFAPRGEPSRRGRGGFRSRGNLTRRVDGYGPPSSKSPFGQQSEENKLDSTEKDNKDNKNNEPKTDESVKNDIGGEMLNSDDKIKQHPPVGIIGSSRPTNSAKSTSQIPPRMQRNVEGDRRDNSHSKGGRGSSGSRGGSHSQGRNPSGKASHKFGGVFVKQNSSDFGDENWETTSENSEVEDWDRKEDPRSRRRYNPRQHDNRRYNRGPRHSPQYGSCRVPGAEKHGGGYSDDVLRGSVNDNFCNRGGDDNHTTGNRNFVKDTTSMVNRVDNFRANEPALADLGKKNINRVEKMNSLEGIDLNNYASVVIVDDQPEVQVGEESLTFDADGGFQEVRSKKVKDSRQKGSGEEQRFHSPANAKEQRERKVKQPSQNMMTQQTGNSSSGGPVTSVSPPTSSAVGAQAPKMHYERPRQKLPPRFAKQKENIRLQKGAQQGQTDVSEMNKLNQAMNLFSIKDSTSPAPPPSVNAWVKPINSSLRPNSPGSSTTGSIQLTNSLPNTTENCSIEINEQSHSGASSQRSTPNEEKTTSIKLSKEVVIEKSVLDGSSPPVQTIIFENTNYKTSPPELAIKAKFNNPVKLQRIEKDQLGDESEEVTTISFTSGSSNMLSEINKIADVKADPIQMPIGFSKNEDSDMKLDFTFDSDLSQLTEDKTSKGIVLPRPINMSSSPVQPNILRTACDLDEKIASCKKVWEMPAMPTVIEHTEDVNATSTASSFTPTFGNAVDTGIDPGSFSKAVEAPTDDSTNEVVYSPGPALQGNHTFNSPGSTIQNMKNDPTSTSSNVCKVKPQQQTAVLSAGPSPIGHPGSGALSPPPFNSTTGQPSHINFQPTLGGTTPQFGGISAIPSPPTVLYNSSQPIQGGLYGAYQIDGSQVLGGQARSQFSQFPPYGLSQGLNQTSAFNQQSMYLQTAPHPPPPSAVHDMNMSQFRIQAQAPFGQSQQLSNNPNTVLISSSSNSLMSASVKPSTQPIGAIGTKGASPYQQNAIQSAPQPSQVYIQYDPSQVLNVNQNYLSSSPIVQRPAPVQSNVVPAIQPSTSYYSGSSGQTGFFQPANTTLQAVQQQAPSAQAMHQTGNPYGLQQYGTQSNTGTPVGLQNFGSQFLSSHLQMPQQYRNTPPTYMKAGPDHSAQNGRSQLKSPSSTQQDVLSSVFSSAPQIPSPKIRNTKPPPQQQHPPPQQSPTQQQQHKYNSYQGVTSAAQLSFQPNIQRGQMNIGMRPSVQANTPRYPAPIQRPVPPYQHQQNSTGNGMMGTGARTRPPHPPSTRPLNINKVPNSQGGQPYYGSPHGSNMKMDNATENKNENISSIPGDASLTDGNSVAAGNGSSASGPKASAGNGQQSSVDISKNTDEASAPSAE